MITADRIWMNSQSSWDVRFTGMGIATLFILFLLIFSSVLFSEKPAEELIQSNRPADLLREIYEEVTGLERIGNDGFIKGEFHINLDGNEENKEEHIVVLNHFASGREKMLLQVTYFESRRKNSPVKYAKIVREIECCVMDKGIEIERCDYSDAEIHSLLPGVLAGIRDKKKILKLIE